jgi:hypothetical protein
MPHSENQSLSWWNLSLSLSLSLTLSLSFSYGRAWSVAGYPEKCTHRYCADTKVVLRPKTSPSPAECAELLLPNNRFLISPQPKDLPWRTGCTYPVHVLSSLSVGPVSVAPSSPFRSSFIHLVNFASILHPFIPAILSASDRRSYR